jgi:hypothetical protein
MSLTISQTENTPDFYTVSTWHVPLSMDVPTLNPIVLDALSESCRRIALAVLLDHGGTVSRAELATLMARGDQVGTAGSDPADPETVRTALHHVHLPVLADAGAVDYDHDTGLVRPAKGSSFDSEWVGRLLADHAGADYDGTLAALASERRQAVLYELFASSEPVSERGLARSVTARERGCDPADVTDAAVEVTHLSLSHTHLPMLADVGFVSVDGDDGRLELGRLPWRSDPWVAVSPIAEWAALD